MTNLTYLQSALKVCHTAHCVCLGGLQNVALNYQNEEDISLKKKVILCSCCFIGPPDYFTLTSKTVQDDTHATAQLQIKCKLN